MSSVVIAGNTSGSVTLLAPDVAGSVVVTLPSSSMTLAAGPGGMQAFTANGTFTIPAGKTAVKVTIVGGGGGGRDTSDGPGGGGGGAAISVLTGLTPGATISVTIGAAGLGGIEGTNGGTSSVTSGTQTISTISATGGNGNNNNNTNSFGGNGGLGSGGQLNLRGGSGQYGNSVFICGSNIYFSGLGGSTILSGNANIAQNGVNGGGGGGGSGLTVPSGNAGDGGVGIVVFEW